MMPPNFILGCFKFMQMNETKMIFNFYDLLGQ